MRGRWLSAGHHEVREAVAVQVADRRAALVALHGEVGAEAVGDVGELLAVHVAEHRVRLLGARPDVVDVAVRRVDVLPAVVVVVDELRAPAGERARELRDAGARRGVAEVGSGVVRNSAQICAFRLL
jgi:hypothetical protein